MSGRLHKCIVCGEPGTYCAACGRACYCSKAHQKQEWRSHKHECYLLRPLKDINFVSGEPSFEGWTTHDFSGTQMVLWDAPLPEYLAHLRTLDAVPVDNSFLLFLVVLAKIRPDAPRVVYDVSEGGDLFFQMVEDEIHLVRFTANTQPKFRMWCIQSGPFIVSIDSGCHIFCRRKDVFAQQIATSISKVVGDAMVTYTASRTNIHFIVFRPEPGADH